MKIVNITSPAPFPSARPPYADGAGMPAGKAARYHRCPECDAFFSLPIVKRNQTANCPRCNARVSSGRDWSISRLAAMAVAMLVLMPFAYTEPLISIRLLGVSINASLFEGIWQMTRQGHPITASMVAFCTVGAPLTLVFSLLYLFLRRASA